VWRRLLPLTILAGFGCQPRAAPRPFVAPASRPPSPTSASLPPSLPSVRDLGDLSMPRLVVGRDGGAAGLVGGRMLWTFGDTLMTGAGADGFNYRSATAAWGDGASLSLTEPLDAAGAPFQLLPYTDDELAYNRAGGPGVRYALWPGRPIAMPDGSALLFYGELKVGSHGNFDWTAVGTGLAHLAPGSTVATREPGLLFPAPEPGFSGGGLVIPDGAAGADTLYLYRVDPIPGKLDSECRVGRVPLARVSDHDAYAAWDGAAWTSDLARAVPILHGAAGGVSVSWNAYLGAYLAVYSGIFSSDVLYRTAPRPEGPFSEPHLLFTAAMPSGQTAYAATEHPELSSDGGRTLVVSYARPLGGFRGTVHLVAVTLP